jgi:non-specific serine/threonine protein kinase
LPLALELAAARIRLLSAEQIAARLDDAFRLLTDGHRNAPPRHQTLRAALDWSHDLLSGAERALFRRLAAFAGGFDLEAVEAVCADSELQADSLLGILSQLADKSLVHRPEHESHGPARYRLLEPVRQYALEKLHAGHDDTPLRDRHLAWCLALAGRAEAEATGRAAAQWLDRLETEHDNVRAGMRWSLQSPGHAESGIKLAAVLWPLWHTRGHWSEGRKWLEQMLAVHALVAGPPRARLLYDAGTLALFQNDFAHAGSRLAESLEVYRALGDRRSEAGALFQLARVAGDTGEYARAVTLAEESLRIRRELGNRQGSAYTMRLLGELARDQGDSAQAATLAAQSLELFRALDEKPGIALALTLAALIACDRGDYPAAAACATECLSLRRTVGDKRGIGMALHMQALAEAGRGNPGAARIQLQGALRLLAEVGDRWFVARGLEAMAQFGIVEMDYARSARLLGSAHALRRAIRSPVAPVDRAALERIMAAAQAGLGAGEFETHYGEGYDLTLEQAVALALETPANAPPAGGDVVETHELRVFALGPARVYRGAHLLTGSDWTYARARELALYLLTPPGATREQIALEFWPEASAAQVRSRFSAVLARARANGSSLKMAVTLSTARGTSGLMWMPSRPR